jgi:hypothetical protein
VALQIGFFHPGSSPLEHSWEIVYKLTRALLEPKMHVDGGRILDIRTYGHGMHLYTFRFAGDTCICRRRWQ